MADNKKEITSIQISKDLKEKLTSLGKMGQTYEDVIWDLVKKLKL